MRWNGLLRILRSGTSVSNRGRVEILDQVEHVVLVDEAHFEVELGELRLAVAARVLVAEALGDLEVFFHSRRHEKLLELLRRLRQGVELAGVQAARNEIVPRALRRALDEDGSLDVEEAALAEEVADELDGPMAHDQHVAHFRTAQVEVAVLEPQKLVDFALLVDVEGGSLGLVQDGHAFDRDLDLAGGEVRVDRLVGTLRHAARHLHDPLASHLPGEVVRLRVQVGVEDGLHDAGAVAQVDEYQVAVVPSPVNPSRQRNLLSLVVASQLSAVDRLEHVPLLSVTGQEL